MVRLITARSSSCLSATLCAHDFTSASTMSCMSVAPYVRSDTE